VKEIKFEVCCGSLEDVLVAEEFGADRAELNSAIFLGGLTPSYATMALTREKVSIPTVCMIRPREGGFCYSDLEFEIMQRDLLQAKEFGFEGVVLGCLEPNGEVNLRQMRGLRDLAGDMEVVCHRALDVVPDTERALEQLIDLGFTRVLTAGRRNDVFEAKELFRELFKQAGDRIQILPGGELHLHILPYFLQDMPMVTQVHIGPFARKVDTSTQGNPETYFGGILTPPEDRYTAVSEELMARFAEWRNR
jgi:copper homeostasis protein